LAEENFDEFADYLNEQENILDFDSEICPVCGINLSDKITIHSFPYIELKFDSEKSASEAIRKIEKRGIKTKQSSDNKEVILVAEQKLEEVKKILDD